MNFYLEGFAVYLKTERRLSDYTTESYLCDIRQYIEFLKLKNVSEISNSTNSILLSYMFILKRKIWHLLLFIVSYLL